MRQGWAQGNSRAYGARGGGSLRPLSIALLVLLVHGLALLGLIRFVQGNRGGVPVPRVVIVAMESIVVPARADEAPAQQAAPVARARREAPQRLPEKVPTSHASFRPKRLEPKPVVASSSIERAPTKSADVAQHGTDRRAVQPGSVVPEHTEVVGETVAWTAPQAGTTGGAHGGQASVLDAYVQGIRQKILRYRPTDNTSAGRVVVAFALAPDGHLLSLELAHSSGDFELDQAALRSVRRAAPFSAAPQGTTMGQLRFTLPFDYKQNLN